MGDYYKIKKILLILLIVSVIFRIINQTKVFATEAVEVTPTWNDGTYTIQADNLFYTLQNNQIEIQNNIIYNLRLAIKNGYLSNVRTLCDTLFIYMGSPNNGTTKRVIYFKNNGGGSGSSSYGWSIECVFLNSDIINSIISSDATLNSGYKLFEVPFYSYNRSNLNFEIRWDGITCSRVSTIYTGSVLIPCAELGTYSTQWLDLFIDTGVINSLQDYNNVLNNISGSVDELEGYAYSSAYYAR